MTDPAIRLQIREATRVDHGAIREMAAAANDEFRGPMGDTLFRAYLGNVLDIESRMAAGIVLVADLDGDVAGTITLYRDVHDEGMPVRFPPGTAGLRATAVAPSARGRGIGNLLVSELIPRARSSGALRIALHTAWCMGPAIRLYERHGFTRRPEFDYVANEFFADGHGDPLDAIAFVLELNDS